MAKASPYASLSATREVLDAYGLAAKYSLGQNFLVNDDVVRKTLELAQVRPGDAVLEVGPGIGTLSTALLGAGARVVAVERDADLVPVLAETTFPWEDRFALIRKDALDLSALDLAQAFGRVGVSPDTPFSLVANLPYAVAATVVLDYFQCFPRLASATVMVQREVADRMMARPATKAYGAYTVKLGLLSRPAGRFPVGPANFFPQPRVDSAVIRLDRRGADAGLPGRGHLRDEGNRGERDAQPDGDAPRADGALLAAACAMTDAAFASRRKTIANSFRQYFSGREGALGAEGVAALLAEAAIDPKRRGETLDRAEFLRLGAAYLSLAPQAGTVGEPCDGSGSKVPSGRPAPHEPSAEGRAPGSDASRGPRDSSVRTGR